MKNNTESALKVKEIICIFLILIAMGTSIHLMKIAKNKIEIAKQNSEEVVQVAVTESYERDANITSRSEVERTLEEPVIEEVKYKTIEEIEISRDMDLSIRTGISREDFIKLMENMKVDYSGFFAENAGIIYDLCEKYEINEVFFCGLIAAESGWNIASNHKSANNYISMMSGGKLIRYNTAEEGLEAAAKLLHNKYLTPGGGCYYGKTLSCVQKCFCPNSSTWVGLVFGCMKQVIK